ncbi:hypothetical protein C0J52_10502 [Blattella germanica]|nr:hypothetical protein C0J52_10502 [Blattella germanica]
MILAAASAVVSAGFLGAPAPFLSYAAAPAVAYSTHSVPQYSFSYGVKDPHTGDSKAAHETRSGDVVHGSYTVADPDGTIRTVKYTADHVNGFNAVVERSPDPAVYAAAVKTIAAPAVYATHAPVSLKTVPAPTVYAAPAPVAVKTVAAPAVYAPAPVAVKTVAAPAVYAASTPLALKTYAAAPTVYAAHGHLTHTVYAAAPTVYAAASPAYYAAPVPTW